MKKFPGKETITLSDNTLALPATKRLSPGGIMVPLEEMLCGHLNIENYLYMKTEYMTKFVSPLYVLCVRCLLLNRENV